MHSKKPLNTKVVNLFGGPGIGKSYMAFEVCANLKKEGFEVELALEYAKDLVWQKRYETLRCQPYVFGKQLHKIETLLGQVDYIITDSPLLLSVIYGDLYSGKIEYGDLFQASIVQISKQIPSLNFLLSRKFGFVQNGRNENLEESIAIDERIKITLDNFGIQYYYDLDLNGIVDKIKEDKNEANMVD